MADVYVNALTELTSEPATTDSIVIVNRGTNEGKIIDYNKLADAILSKLASKQFSSLTTASKLLPGAINELDADVSALNSRFLKNDNLVTVSSNYGTCRYGYFKIGDIVIVALSITPSASVTFPGDTSLLNQNLPSPFSGYSLVPISCKNGPSPVDAYIRYNGELRIRSAVTTSAALTFSGVYIN